MKLQRQLRRIPNEFTSIIYIFAISRVLFYLTAILLTKLHRIPFNPKTFCHFDCYWYLSIANEGYADASKAKSISNLVFFPLEPLMMRAIANFAKIDIVLVAALMGNLFVLGGLLFLGAYLRKSHSKKVIYSTAFLISFSPCSLVNT